MITLTMQQIKELAEFTGLVVDAEGFDDMNMADQYVIADCPVGGVKNEDEPETSSHYEFVAYCADYPEEGCIGLGPEIDPPALLTAPVDAVSNAEWSGWATQYPGKMPVLRGAREIAELNFYPEEGQRLLFLTTQPPVDLWRFRDAVEFWRDYYAAMVPEEEIPHPNQIRGDELLAIIDQHSKEAGDDN